MITKIRVLGALLPPCIYSHLWFKGVFRTTILGSDFKIFHTGSDLENDLFWRNKWLTEEHTLLTFSRLLSAVDAVIDIGANVGLFSLVAKSLNPNLAVVALEPSPNMYSVLQSNVSLNNLDITCLKAAATSENKPVTLYDFPGLSSSASLEPTWRENTTTVTVNGVRVDGVIRENNLSGKKLLIKLDIEGHEPEALAGLTETIHISPPPIFLIEIIRDEVAKGVSALLPPNKFQYMFLDEDQKAAVDLTAKFVSMVHPVTYGNYLIITPDQLKAIPSIQR